MRGNWIELPDGTLVNLDNIVSIKRSDAEVWLIPVDPEDDITVRFDTPEEAATWLAGLKAKLFGNYDSSWIDRMHPDEAPTVEE